MLVVFICKKCAKNVATMMRKLFVIIFKQTRLCPRNLSDRLLRWIFKNKLRKKSMSSQITILFSHSLRLWCHTYHPLIRPPLIDSGAYF